MIHKVPVSVIFLTILLSRYLEYIRGINLPYDLIIGLSVAFLFLKLSLKYFAAIMILIIITLHYSKTNNTRNILPTEDVSYVKELNGLAMIESLEASKYKERTYRVFSARFISLNAVDAELVGKKIFFLTDMNNNFKKNHVYVVKGILKYSNCRENIFLFNTNIYENIPLYEKRSNVFFKEVNISKTNQAFLKAFLFGDKSQLTVEQLKIFKNSGTIHIFAVSGLHVICLFFFVLFLFRFLNFSVKKRIIYTIIVLFGYLYLVDFSVSATRAYLMILLWSLSRLIGIKSSPYSLVCTTGIILLLIKPEHIISIGFILSISVVLSIIWIMNDTRLASKSIIISKLFQICLVNYAAFWGSFIVLAKVFGIIVPVSLLSNLVLIPVVSILMPFAFLGLFFLQFSYLYFIAGFFEWPLFQIIKICHWFSSFSWSTFLLESNSQELDVGLFLVIIFFVASFAFTKNILLKLIILPVAITLVLFL